MRAVAAEIEPLDWRPVSRPTQLWPHGENLVEGKFPVIRMPASQAEFGLHICGRNYLRADNLR